MTNRSCRALALASGFALVFAVPSRADVTLRYQFKKGESAKYVIDNDLSAKIDFNGSAIEFSMKMIFDVTWSVNKVADDGVAELSQKIDRVQLKMDSPLAGNMDYDSATPDSEPDSPIWATMGKTIKEMREGEFILTVSPAGVVKEIKLPAKLEESFSKRGGQRRGGGPGGGGFGALLNGDAIKQQISRAFVPLPEGPAKKDATWKQKLETKFGNAGTQQTEVTYTYKGEEAKDGKEVASIASKSDMKFVPNEEGGGDVDAEITDQKGAGAALFDIKSGKLVSSKFDQQVVMTVTARDNEITQDFTTVTTIKEGKSANPPAPPAKKEKSEGKDAKKSEEKKD